MDKSRSLSLAVVFTASLLVISGVAAQSGGAYDVEWQVLAGAGEQFVSGGGYQLGFTLAQDTPPLVSSGDNHQIIQGYWLGVGSQPTAVTLASFWVEARDNALVICWETATEMDLLGFHLYRSDTGAPVSFVRLNEGLIPSQSPGSSAGATYEWVDAGVSAGQTHFYLLEDVDVYGKATRHGPVVGSLPTPGRYHYYLPLVEQQTP